MSYTTKDFIVSKMVRDSIPFFQIKDSSNKYLLEENNLEKDSEKASKLFIECISAMEGDSVFVRISDKQFRGEEAQGGTLKSGCFSYTVKLLESKQNKSINGIDNLHFHSQLERLENENKQIKEELKKREESERKSEISGLQQKIIELENKGSELHPVFEQLIMHIGNAVISSNPQILGNEPKAINDNLDTKNMANTKELTDSEILSRLNKAIGILAQNDPHYLQNIERLAIVVVKKPQAYKQAVSMLKMMV